MSIDANLTEFFIDPSQKMVSERNKACAVAAVIEVAARAMSIVGGAFAILGIVHGSGVLLPIFWGCVAVQSRDVAVIANNFIQFTTSPLVLVFVKSLSLDSIVDHLVKDTWVVGPLFRNMIVISLNNA